MLRITIPQRQILGNSKTKIKVEEIEIKNWEELDDAIAGTIYDGAGGENEAKGSVHREQQALCCYCDNITGLREGQDVILSSDLSSEEENSDKNVWHKVRITAIDKESKMFTTLVPKYEKLSLSGIEFRTELYGKYVYFRFSERHYLSVSMAEEIEDEIDTLPQIFIKYRTNEGIVSETVKFPVDVVDDFTLRLQVGKEDVEGDKEWNEAHPNGVTYCPKCDATYECEYSECLECGYEYVTYKAVSFTYLYGIEGLEYTDQQILESVLVGLVFESNDGLFSSINDGYGDISLIEIYCDTPYFSTKDSFSIYLNESLGVGIIPLSNTSKVDLHNEGFIKENVIDKFMNSEVNGFTDMEKNVYYPVLKNGEGSFEDVYKINFNLHFRHRVDNETWKPQPNEFWNGIYAHVEKPEDDEGGVLYGLEFIPNQHTTDKEHGYEFLWSAEVNGQDDDAKRFEMMARQSDLLTYLGFDKYDVINQKNRLKKSFLKVSFYDSDQLGSQNLLGVSTIFIDSGDLFAKYVRHIDDEIDVNKELENGVKSDDESFEDIRLSSHLEVKDKYNSRRSSEGFYFYTYADNSMGAYPQSMYAKFEFHHAKYGCVVPMMLPYWGPHNLEKTPYNLRGENWDETCYVYDAQGGTTVSSRSVEDKETRCFKTFDEIRDDWSDGIVDEKGLVKMDGEALVRKDLMPTEENPLVDGKYVETGYGAVKLHKYVFVKFKYQFDKETMRHVYYLDPEYYGKDATTEHQTDNELTINLYECMVR